MWEAQTVETVLIYTIENSHLKHKSGFLKDEEFSTCLQFQQTENHELPR